MPLVSLTRSPSAPSVLSPACSVLPCPSGLIPFRVFRHEDVNGNTGCGVVAEGMIFTDGKCVMRWLGAVSSIATFDCLEDLIEIHGHGGKTIVLLHQ